MFLTYYVALPFVKSDDGTAPGQAMECQSEYLTTDSGLFFSKPHALA